MSIYVNYKIRCDALRGVVIRCELRGRDDELRIAKGGAKWVDDNPTSTWPTSARFARLHCAALVGPGLPRNLVRREMSSPWSNRPHLPLGYHPASCASTCDLRTGKFRVSQKRGRCLLRLPSLPCCPCAPRRRKTARGDLP